jgi:hypothetical protein
VRTETCDARDATGRCPRIVGALCDGGFPHQCRAPTCAGRAGAEPLAAVLRPRFREARRAERGVRASLHAGIAPRAPSACQRRVGQRRVALDLRPAKRSAAVAANRGGDAKLGRWVSRRLRDCRGIGRRQPPSIRAPASSLKQPHACGQQAHTSLAARDGTASTTPCDSQLATGQIDRDARLPPPCTDIHPQKALLPEGQGGGGSIWWTLHSPMATGRCRGER